MYIITLPIEQRLTQEDITKLSLLAICPIPWGGDVDKCLTTFWQVHLAACDAQVNTFGTMPSTSALRRAILPTEALSHAHLVGYHYKEKGLVWLIKERRWGLRGWVTEEDYRGLVRLHMEVQYDVYTDSSLP